MKRNFILLLLVIIPLILSSTNWYVDASATPPGNGSQSTPYVEISDAIEVLSDGDIVYVAAGTYNETVDFADHYFDLVGEAKNTTIIDGDDSSDGIILPAGGTPITGLSTIKSLTVTNCCTSQQSDGAGISIENRNVLIDNCLIQQNSSNRYGGGVFFKSAGDNSYTLTLTDCTICDNETDNDGGGIYFTGENSDNIEIEDCEIYSNVCLGYGGGIYISGTSSNDIDVKLENLIIYDNTAHDGSGTGEGGGIYCDYADMTSGAFDHLLVYENSADVHGAGIALFHPAANFVINKVTVVENENTGANAVAGIYCAASFTLSNSIVYDNTWTSGTATQVQNNGTNEYSCIEDDNSGTNIDDDPCFVDAGGNDYQLEQISPCIDCGDPSYDHDDDGTVIDMGYYTAADHDLARFMESWGATVNINWIGFPRLDVSDGVNNGEYVEATDMLDLFEYTDNPFGIDVYYLLETARLSGEWDEDEYSWHPTSYSDLINSIRGFKFKVWDSGLSASYLRVFGDVVDPETDITIDVSEDENWVCYFLEDTQDAEDAFSSATLSQLYKVVTRNWTAVKTIFGWSFPQNSTFSYGDLVIIEDDSVSDFDFIWQEPSRELIEPYERPEPTQFSYQEEMEYLPVFMEFGEEVPLEVGVYVDNVCKGAEVVDSDSLFQLRAYVLDEEPGYELVFVFYYGRSEKQVMDYRIDNSYSQYSTDRLITGNLGEYAFIEFGDPLSDDVPELETDLKVYPNPFNPTIQLWFQAGEHGNYDMAVYNLKGQKVKTILANEYCTKGDRIERVWKGLDDKGSKVSGGVYFVRVTSPHDEQVRKVILLK